MLRILQQRSIQSICENQRPSIREEWARLSVPEVPIDDFSAECPFEAWRQAHCQTSSRLHSPQRQPVQAGDLCSVDRWQQVPGLVSSVAKIQITAPGVL